MFAGDDQLDQIRKVEIVQVAGEEHQTMVLFHFTLLAAQVLDNAAELLNLHPRTGGDVFQDRYLQGLPSCRSLPFQSLV